MELADSAVSAEEAVVSEWLAVLVCGSVSGILTDLGPVGAASGDWPWSK